MFQRILVPWAMPEIGRELLKRSKKIVIPLHGAKGELPPLKELIKAIPKPIAG